MVKLFLHDKKGSLFHYNSMALLLLFKYCVTSDFVLLLSFSVTLSNVIIFVVQLQQPNFPTENNTLSYLLLNILVWAVWTAFMWAWITKNEGLKEGRPKTEKTTRWQAGFTDTLRDNTRSHSDHTKQIWILIPCRTESQQMSAKAAEQQLREQQRHRRLHAK